MACERLNYAPSAGSRSTSPTPGYTSLGSRAAYPRSTHLPAANCGPCAALARTRAKPLSILERAGGTDERRRLPPDDDEAWEGRKDALRRAPAHAAPCLRVQTCQ